MSKIIRWENLPDRQYKSTKKETRYEIFDICTEVALEQALQAAKWAVIKICKTGKEAHSLVWLLKQNRIKLPEGEFDFASRELAVYARFVGKK